MVGGLVVVVVAAVVVAVLIAGMLVDLGEGVWGDEGIVFQHPEQEEEEDLEKSVGIYRNSEKKRTLRTE